jgi:hypothetical protein
MPERITSNRLTDFLTALEQQGGSSGNRNLRQHLGWDEEFYWRVQGKLIESGEITTGRGKGGSVRRTKTEPEEPSVTTRTIPSPTKPRERDSYARLKEAIEKTWINRFAFDEFRVEETHSRGSKDTGGTFTRPDITAAGVRRYVYLSKRLEIVTFEVKLGTAVDVMGVLEAIAHREAAHLSYVIFVTSMATFESAPEVERIRELSQKYGIGVIVAESPDSVETWELTLDAVRHEPDPARLDRFLKDLPSESIKNQLSKWKE